MSEWISVEDRLPKIPKYKLHAERPVLVVNDGKVCMAFLCAGRPTGHRQWDMSEQYEAERNWFNAEADDSYRKLGNVTHWQDLPLPPKA
ncbi:DUF551 domain-containing protein [Pseudomonas luteola]|uniref:DUF551 domain-containing protein n=1 Tax=Pseudomonas luteola TaxID=47886 RepID=UPI003DA02BBC